MVENDYIDKNKAVDEGYLVDWYIRSVAEYNDEKLNEPRWTEEHIAELAQDFIIIPKDTPAADVAPFRHGFWGKETLPFKDKQGNQHFGACCSSCGAILDRTKYCGECGAKMDGKENGK